MVKKKKSSFRLLFLIASAPCLCFSQLSNHGLLSVSSGTSLSSVSLLENSQGAVLVNDGDFSLYDDFKNDGTLGFTSGVSSGVVRFEGTKAGSQLISGNGTSDFYNLVFNNDNSGFQLSSNLKIYGKAYFQKGIVDAKGGVLYFEDNAVAENVDDISYVNGPVVKIGSSAFTFPIGDGGKFRAVSISAPNSLDASLSGRYFLSTPDINYPVANMETSLNLIDNVEYWVVKKENVLSGNFFVSLTWDESITPSLLLSDFENLHVAGWDEEKKLWVDLGGVVDFSKKEVTAVSNLKSDYGIFTLARSVSSSQQVLALHPGISPNGDGINDELMIEGLSSYPDNKVTVFDRFGKIVFETKSYNSKGNVFKGFTDQNSSEVLPLGTYFYTVDYLDTLTGRRVKKSNYLYINLR